MPQAPPQQWLLRRGGRRRALNDTLVAPGSIAACAAVVGPQLSTAPHHRPAYFRRGQSPPESPGLLLLSKLENRKTLAVFASASRSDRRRPTRRKSRPGKSVRRPARNYFARQSAPVADSLLRFRGIPKAAPAGKGALDRSAAPPPAPWPDEIEILYCSANKPARFDSPSRLHWGRRLENVLRRRRTIRPPAYEFSCDTADRKS